MAYYSDPAYICDIEAAERLRMSVEELNNFTVESDRPNWVVRNNRRLYETADVTRLVAELGV